MIYVLVGLSILFVAVGFVVTKGNARYILSGYNTMSEEERKKVDLDIFIPSFRKFHIFLGISFLLLGAILHFGVSENAGGIFITVYPIMAYLFFIWRSSKFSSGLNTKWRSVGIVALLIALAIVVPLLALGFKESKLVYYDQTIAFEGIYSEKLTIPEIETIELVNQLPEITLKTNGFALGTINKGYFKTKEGEIIKLILNSDAKPYLLLTKKNGKKIYYSSGEKSNATIFNELKKAFPDLEFK